MLTRQRVCKALFWGAFFLLTCLGGVVGFAYWYVTDSGTVSALIRSESRRFLPSSVVSLGNVRWRPLLGEISLKEVQVNQKVDGTSFQTLRLAWAQVEYDAWGMFNGKPFALREVVVAHPVLRLRQRKDGSWNLKGLLADPWPGPMMKTPPILIKQGIVELSTHDASKPESILRDVALEIKPKPGPGKLLEFEGSAKGDVFNRLALRGTVDLDTGRLTINGDITRLAISETLRSRLPAEIKGQADELGLNGGELDLRVAEVVYDKTADPPIRYDVAAQLRSGVWGCPHLPFPINDLTASFSVRDGVLQVEQATGVNGPTRVSVANSRIVLSDPENSPFNLNLSTSDLELDQRLRDKTPDKFQPLWKDFTPSGRVDGEVQLVREREGERVKVGWAVRCRDVAMNYRFFRYPLEHISGILICENNQIRVNLQTVLGGKPLTATGTIDNPGDYAHVELEFEGTALPIDKTLFDALPPDIRKVVNEFHPTGLVSGKAHVKRTRTHPDEPPEGKVEVHALLDLNEHCAIQWDGLPYPVSNLTGQLELHPDKWIFRNMKGTNGQAEISGSGEVVKLPDEPIGLAPLEPNPNPKPNSDEDPESKSGKKKERLAVDLRMRAEKLPFNEQLRDALPQAWRKSWEALNPNGSSRVEATIRLRPDEPDQYHLVIDPRPETSVNLKFGPPTKPGAEDRSGIFELRMEKVSGRFVFDNGVVNMENVGFLFYGSPVKCGRGRVVVEDSGAFQLNAERVEVAKLRLDQDDLVAIMPPVMKDFARRLDPGRPISSMKGNLGLSWSGKLGDSVRCNWDHVLVVLNDNKINAGIPLEHMQGQLDHVQGRFDGQNLMVGGALSLASVSLLGQQITELESPFVVAQGRATLSNISGKLLNGQARGKFAVSLDTTPRYSAELTLEKADLKRYAETINGHQSYSGEVSGWLSFYGMGNDLRTLNGNGAVNVAQGNLGELPALFSLIKKLQTSKVSQANKAAFDAADVTLKIQNGVTHLDSIKLLGNVISFQGRGTMDVQGHLALQLNPLAGRDRFHVPILSDAIREASGQLFVVKAHGTISDPKFEISALPRVADGVRSISIGRGRGFQSGREPQ